MIAHIFNPTSEFVIPSGILASKAKPEMERHPLTAEIKRRECSK